MAIICPWCGAIIAGRPKDCPDCGVFLARLSRPAAAPAPPHLRSPVILWLLAGVPVIVSVVLPVGALALRDWNQAPAAYSNPHDSNSAEDRIWTAGMMALRAKLGDPRFNGLSESSVHIGAGHLITLCGRAKVPAPGGSITTRYLSMEGRRRDTMLELQDPTFEVLWTRLCHGSYGGGW